MTPRVPGPACPGQSRCCQPEGLSGHRQYSVARLLGRVRVRPNRTRCAAGGLPWHSRLPGPFQARPPAGWLRHASLLGSPTPNLGVTNHMSLATSPKYAPASEKELCRNGWACCIVKAKNNHALNGIQKKRCIDITGCTVLNFAALLPSFFAQDSLSSSLHKILMRFAQQQEGRTRDTDMLRMFTSRDSTPLRFFSAVRFLGSSIHSKIN